tara:strand:+ start:223 stop:381 length:159 start_codon:yes stop_codon:yes gene_type:complete
MANNKKIVVLDMDSIVRSSVDMDVFNQLPVTKKLRIFHHANEIIKIVQSHPL